MLFSSESSLFSFCCGVCCFVIDVVVVAAFIDGDDVMCMCMIVPDHVPKLHNLAGKRFVI